VCDDFSGYKACFELGVTEAGCLAHARRKFHELWVNHASQVGEQALKFFVELYDIEREVRDIEADERKNASDKRDHARSPMRYISGSPRSGRRCPTGRPPPGPSTTASSAGRR
jgi:Transposase IS66 family